MGVAEVHCAAAGVGRDEPDLAGLQVARIKSRPCGIGELGSFQADRACDPSAGQRGGSGDRDVFARYVRGDISMGEAERDPAWIFQARAVQLDQIPDVTGTEIHFPAGPQSGQHHGAVHRHAAGVQGGLVIAI